jgi:hypothetical protein
MKESTGHPPTTSIKLQHYTFFLLSAWVCPRTRWCSDDSSGAFRKLTSRELSARQNFQEIFSKCFLLKIRLPLFIKGQRMHLRSEAVKRSDVRSSKLRHDVRSQQGLSQGWLQSQRAFFCTVSIQEVWAVDFSLDYSRRPIVNISVN